MGRILAIDTSTELCSVAIQFGQEISERFESVPRQHNRRLFSMLAELLPSGDLSALQIDALAYGQGPGSFTGLRIAASAVQGLAYAHGLPVIGVSTLLCQAQSALRLGLVSQQDKVLSLIDARVDELYWSVLTFEQGVAVESAKPRVCKPEQLLLDDDTEVVAIGSGLHYKERLPQVTRRCIVNCYEQCNPYARDLLPVANDRLQAGKVSAPMTVAPHYVRREISWKKLPQQGKPQ